MHQACFQSTVLILWRELTLISCLLTFTHMPGHMHACVHTHSETQTERDRERETDREKSLEKTVTMLLW